MLAKHHFLLKSADSFSRKLNVIEFLCRMLEAVLVFFLEQDLYDFYDGHDGE